MSDDTPRQLGRYELVRRIAAGGMGEIYLARTSGTAGFEKTVIIKKILPHLAEQEEFVDKFLDEGRIVVNLTHGNIVPVFDMDEVDGEYFIAMEYVPGRDLRDVLAEVDERDETMPVELAAHVISNVCEGLAYAHRQTDDAGESLDIVHRDVSPSNILLSTDGEVKIIDFGIARAADRRAETVTGQVQGKCCYMSPEQATGQPIDARSDIFSTGVVLYEMLTGIRPFEGESDLESLDKVRKCDYAPPSEHREDLPATIDAIVERAMQKDPDDRYDAIADMKVDLVEFLVERGRAVTSEEVAEFLSDLFPDGLERDEFREAREEETSAPMNLDEALEQQLDDIGETPGDSIDPMDPTAPAPDEEARPGSPGRTETLTPETGLDESDPETPNESDETTGTAEPAGPDPGAPSATNGGDDSPNDGRSVAIFIAIALVGGGSLAAWFALGETSPGTLEIKSTPSGADIRIDGSRLAGESTPTRTELEPGRHTIVVSEEGHRDETLRVRLRAGERESLEAELAERSDDPEPRTFQLKTDPDGAELQVNQQPIGGAPAEIRVAPGETKFVEASREGCETAEMPVFYGRDSDRVKIQLECEAERDATNDEEAPSQPTEPARAANPPKTAASDSPSAASDTEELTLVTEPPGAKVTVDGETVGETPVTREFAGDDRVDVRLEKPDYNPLGFTLDVGAVDGERVERELTKRETGCLDFFAVHPQFNEIAIDGEWLEGRHQKLRNYELPVGKHRIRVRNPNADKDETFTFRVEAGDECTSLTVWDPDEG